MDLRSALRLVREDWGLILLAVVLATATSAWFTWRETPQYASQTTLFVSAWGSADDTASAYQGSLLSQQKVKSYTELLRGHQVMTGVINKLHLDLTPRQLAGKVSSSTIPETSLLTANVVDASPQRAQEIADAIGQEFVALVPALENIADAKQPAVKVTVVSPASLPSSPVSPRPVFNISAAVLLGLLAGIGLAMARRSLDTTVKTTEQTEEISGVSSLGSIPFDTAVTKTPLIGPASHGQRAEALRKVRTNLQFADVDRTHQSILVTSANAGEGKTLTACNLAAALGEAEKRVILIDADLRRPRIAECLGLPNGVGLTNVLLGQVSLADATQQWGDRLFATLTSGPVPPNPNTLLTSQRLRELLAELRALYDLVIVDSPPVLPVADAAVLAAACDGAMVVVRHRGTKREQLRRTVQTLGTTGAPILGTVLNSTPPERSAYYRYNYGPVQRREPEHESDQRSSHAGTSKTRFWKGGVGVK